MYSAQLTPCNLPNSRIFVVRVINNGAQGRQFHVGHRRHRSSEHRICARPQQQSIEREGGGQLCSVVQQLCRVLEEPLYSTPVVLDMLSTARPIDNHRPLTLLGIMGNPVEELLLFGIAVLADDRSLVGDVLSSFDDHRGDQRHAHGRLPLPSYATAEQSAHNLQEDRPPASKVAG